MTTSTDSPPRATPRLLRRPREGRVVAGVCAGLSSYTDIDPVVFRVVLAVLVPFGGAGLLLYGIGWLFMPEAGAAGSEADKLLRRSGSGHSLPALAVVALVAVAFAVLVGNADPGLWIALVVLGVFAVYVARRGTPTPTARSASDASESGTGSAAADAPDVDAGLGDPWSAAPPAAPPWAPAPTAPRSPVALVTASVLLIVVGVLAALAAAGVWDGDAGVALATVLLVVAAGLLASVRRGGSVALIALGLLLALGLAGVTAAQATVGDRRFVPAGAASVQGSYHTDVGQLTLDLSDVALAADRRVQVSIGVGKLVVVVPRDVAVVLRGHADVGHVRLLGRDVSGLDAGDERSAGAGAIAGAGFAPTTPTLTVDARVHVGDIEVRRATR